MNRMFFFKRKEKTCNAIAFIYDYAKKSKGSPAYKRKYRNIARHLNNFKNDREIELLSNSYNYDCAEDFAYYLKDLNLAQNTVRAYIHQASHMFRKMAKRGFDVDFSFEDFSAEKEDVETVAISMDEIVKIFSMDIWTKERRVVRDRFIANCLCGMRYGDFSQLTAENIIGNNIYRRTRKTNETVIVPIHPFLKTILEKYNGNFPTYSKSLQNYNKIVKQVCKQAGLNDKVLIEKTIGHKVTRKTFKRWELISSHSARRSFATNAYLAGIPVFRIMLITGHKTEDAFFRYIRIQKKENAEILANHPFFNNKFILNSLSFLFLSTLEITTQFIIY